MPFTITIDGPGAAGKGTLGRAISQQYGLPYLDTGLMYRAAAARALETGEDPVVSAASITGEDFMRNNLRSAIVSQEASRISAIPEVRAKLDAYQVDFANQPGGAVLDGRDIGVSIAPNAPVKLFVTASTEARAKRRHAELSAAGEAASLAEVTEEMRIRDERDAGRAASPMRPADDATIIDTSDMSVDAVREAAFDLIDKAVANANSKPAGGDKWDNRFLELAEHVANWSKDPSTKVGCVLVNADRIVLCMGYNGFPRGVCDCADRLENRSVKYMMIQHAEANALTNAASDVRGATAYVTHAPCANCTGLLIQAGISQIFTRPTPEGLAERFKESYEASHAMLSEAGIPLTFIDPPAH